MNKLTKASIAGAAGIALLLGGAGTLALWNDAESLLGGTIESGTLDIVDVDGEWDVVNEIELWVPGDTYTWTGDIEIAATGDHLQATLAVDWESIVPAGDFADALEFSFVVTGVGFSQAGNLYTITPDQDGDNLTASVTVTVTFPENSVTGLVGQNESVNLGDLAFLLQQTT